MSRLSTLPATSSSSLASQSSLSSKTAPPLSHQQQQHHHPRSGQDPLQPYSRELCRSVASALVREHLSRNKMTATLEKFREEDTVQGTTIASRSALVRYLRMEKVRRNNQSSDEPLLTLVEMLVAHLLAKNPLLECGRKSAEAGAGDGEKEAPGGNASVPRDPGSDTARDVGEEETFQGTGSRSFFARGDGDGDVQKTTDPVLSSIKGNSAAPNAAGRSTPLPDEASRQLKAPARSALSDAAQSSAVPKPSAKPRSFFDDDVITAAAERVGSSGIKTAAVQVSSAGAGIESSVTGTVRESTPAKQDAAEGVPTVLDRTTVSSLKNLLFGRAAPVQAFNDEWIGKQFTFNKREGLTYGLIQSKGGPCGLLAVVQAYILLNIMFDPDLSPLVEKDEYGLPAPSEQQARSALAKAISGILVTCAKTKRTYTVGWPEKPPLGFSGQAGFGKNQQLDRIITHSFTDQHSLAHFVERHLDNFTAKNQNGLVSLLLSAILTRTTADVVRDMDEPDTALIGAHGYCTQEMVNLLVMGKARSNVFDGTVSLGADGGGQRLPRKILKGLDEQSPFGYLSLFEHYGSLKVGSRMRFPIYPIFVVCSESHYTVLFSPTRACLQLTDDDDDEGDGGGGGGSRCAFDLFYYDGLANQESCTRLTVRPGRRPAAAAAFFRAVDDDDLVPPLELCIRTRWKGAEVDWNGTEPLL